jgi:DNA-binding GntR family transcriptional regulator
MAARDLNVVSTQEALVEALRDRILAGDFAAGSPLSDVALATEYGVARPTLRAAIQALVYEGLMRREPRRRAFVPRLMAQDIRDLYLVRLPLELTAVKALVRRPEALQPAARVVERFERLGEQGSWREAVDADMAFHAALIAGVASPRLERTYGSLQSEIRLALIQLRPAYATVSALAEEHRRLLEAISSGPVSTAVRAMREHLEQAVEDLSTGVPTRNPRLTT